jgi:hypothetical protein
MLVEPLLDWNAFGTCWHFPRIDIVFLVGGEDILDAMMTWHGLGAGNEKPTRNLKVGG